MRSSADRKAFINLPFRLYRDDPMWRAPLRMEVAELIAGPQPTPWFEHARAAFWLAERDGEVVGRISAQVDDLVLEHMGAGTGQWGMFECIDDQGDPQRFAIARGCMGCGFVVVMAICRHG